MNVDRMMLIIFASALILSVGCRSSDNPEESYRISMPKQEAGQVFEFSSGNAFHVEGFGAWQIELNAAGAVTITHDVRGVVRAYDPFLLTEQENAELWVQVRALNIGKTKSTTRKGIPEEVQYTFILRTDTQTHTLSVWSEDARKIQAILTLIDHLASLIHRSTGEQPVLR